MKNLSQNYRTWIEINQAAARRNYEVFRKILEPKAKLWAVIKSNAYGHGLKLFSKLASDLGIDGFCVDSLIEGLRLREWGIKKPILVLGMTLPPLLAKAAEKDITVSVSNFEALKSLLSSKNSPNFHLKIDTGMHRQGFYLDDLPKVIKFIENWKLSARGVLPRRIRLGRRSAFGGQIENSPLRGVYTHFASAKDINYPTYTDFQFTKFQKAARLLERAGFKNLTKHCAATGATLIDKKYHLDAVRLGIGLYGLWPSKELETQLSSKIRLRPILSWRTVVGEVKKLNVGDYIGYDLIERLARPAKMAVLPIGYWHGFPRSLSSIGEAIIAGKRAKVLGRVSMDLLTVDATGIKCRPGDVVTLIGKDGDVEVGADELARKSGTSHYEFLTRINPLIERVLG